MAISNSCDKKLWIRMTIKYHAHKMHAWNYACIDRACSDMLTVLWNSERIDVLCIYCIVIVSCMHTEMLLLTWNTVNTACKALGKLILFPSSGSSIRSWRQHLSAAAALMLQYFYETFVWYDLIVIIVGIQIYLVQVIKKQSLQQSPLLVCPLSILFDAH